MDFPHPGVSSTTGWGPASSAGAASIASVSATAAASVGGGGGGSFRRQSLKQQQQQQNEEASKTFGEIEFSGLKQLAKFVRLDSNTPDSALQQILGKKWDLTRPTLVINIFGGDFEKKRQLKMIFKKGLWKAAESAGCWIVTSGFHLGIMKLTGEAGSVPATYQSEESDSSKPKELRASDEDESPLDPNHTHYFLVDTGATNQKKGYECPFRTRFSHVISSWTDEENKQLKVPMCGLLIGGDRFALEQVFYALTETKCPIVAVKGTAGAADVLSSAFDYLFEEENQVDKKEEDEETQEANFNSKMSNICQEFFNCNDYFDYTKEIDMLRVMLKEGASLIEIFDMEEDFDLDGKMISSLLSSAGSEGGEDQLNLKQLKICLTLNRADIARDKIFLENKKWKDRHDFVKLFLEQGFSLEDFLSIYVLEKLYTDQLKRLSSKVAIFHQLWEYHRSHRRSLGRRLKEYKARQRMKRNQKQENGNSKKVKLREVGKVIKVLVGDFYQPLYAKKDFEKNYTKSVVTAQSPVDQSTTKALVQTAQTGYLPAYFFTKSGPGQNSGSDAAGVGGDNMPQAVPKRRRLQAGDGSQETQLEICEYERSPINFSVRDDDTSDSNARGYENPIMESSSDSPANASGSRATQRG
uniref:LSDAT_euk domain-containing protein n=1 Tax=Macrostomum lignano TaxID=282301 RepID=A0A1I8FY77_9PLAT